MKDSQEQTKFEPKNQAYVDQDVGFNECIFMGDA